MDRDQRRSCRNARFNLLQETWIERLAFGPPPCKTG